MFPVSERSYPVSHIRSYGSFLDNFFFLTFHDIKFSILLVLEYLPKSVFFSLPLLGLIYPRVWPRHLQSLLHSSFLTVFHTAARMTSMLEQLTKSLVWVHLASLSPLIPHSPPLCALAPWVCFQFFKISLSFCYWTPAQTCPS